MMICPRALSLLGVPMAILAFAATASAQAPAPQPAPVPAATPAATPPPAPAPAPVASTLEVAEPQATAFGIGGQLALSGFGGVQVVYNTDKFHIDGLVSFFDEVDTTISLGGRYFYHFNRSERADFSFGAGLGFTHINDADVDVLHFEAVGQIRVFLTPAVVISTTFGVALQSLDADAVGLGTDLLGGAGISYLFY